MKRIINSFLVIIIFTFMILTSYGNISERAKVITPDEIIEYLNSFTIRDRILDQSMMEPQKEAYYVDMD